MTENQLPLHVTAAPRPAVTAGPPVIPPAGGSAPALTITVYGQPKPKGSMRHVGGGHMIEQVALGPPWREAVKWAAYEAVRPHGRDWRPLEGPLAVDAVLTFPKPRSAPKRRVTWPCTRASGDPDKQARNLLDALVDAGIIRDDAQVTDLTVRKRYPGQHPDALDSPGAVIHIKGLPR